MEDYNATPYTHDLPLVADGAFHDALPPAVDALPAIDPDLLACGDQLFVTVDEAGSELPMSPETYSDDDKAFVTELDEQYVDIVRRSQSLTTEERHLAVLTYRRQLRDAGARAAAAITGNAGPLLAFGQAMEYLEFCTEPQNTPDVLALMERCKQRKLDVGPLVRTLARTAHVACIPELLGYVGETTDPAEDPSRLRDALHIAMGSMQRETDPLRKHLWSGAVDTLTASLAPDGDQLLAQSEIELIRKETEPGRMAFSFARLLHPAEPDYHFIPTYPGDVLKQRLGRLNTAFNLYMLAGKLGSIEHSPTGASFILAKLMDNEDVPSPHAVTMGIEIEIPEKTLVDTQGGDMLSVIARTERRLANINRVVGAGMPEDDEESDGIFRELAPDPVNYHGTLTREVQLLFTLDVLNMEGEYPLHMTIGGITTTGPRGYAANILARAIEAAGWTCSATRLREPLHSDGTWAHRGVSGLAERTADELMGDTKQAIEVRSQQLRTLDGFARTARSMYALGAALQAYQTPNGRRNATQAQLAAEWQRFESAVCIIFAGHKMDSPANKWRVRDVDYDHGGNRIAPHLDANFHRLADLLADAEADPSGAGAQFQDGVQRAIIRARTHIMPLLEQTKSVNS